MPDDVMRAARRVTEIRKGDQVLVRGRVVEVAFSTAIIEVGPGLYGLVPVPVDALAPDPGAAARATDGEPGDPDLQRV